MNWCTSRSTKKKYKCTDIIILYYYYLLQLGCVPCSHISVRMSSVVRFSKTSLVATAGDLWRRCQTVIAFAEQGDIKQGGEISMPRAGFEPQYNLPTTMCTSRSPSSCPSYFVVVTRSSTAAFVSLFLEEIKR